MIDQDKINEIINRIAIKFDPDKIILFGSYAKGTPNEDSDLDLLVIKDSDEPRYKRSNEIRKELIGSKIPMDILVYTSEEIEDGKNQRFSFVYNALKESIVVYER
jgi:uncharacterized protein